MTLTITTYDNTIKFEDGSIIKIYRRDINLKRYVGSQKLEILSDSKQNYAVYVIDYSIFTSVKIDGVSIPTVALLESGINDWINAGTSVILESATGEQANITNGGLDVALQDQHTPSVIAKFNKVTNSTTTTTDVAIDDREVTLTSVTGVAVGTYLILFNPESVRFMTATVTRITGSPTFAIDSPFDFAFPAGTYVDVSTTNLKVNGSVTTQIFGLRGVGSPPGVELTVDITRLIFSCTCTSPVNLSKFANFTKLINGLVIRRRDGTYENIVNIKSNREMAGIMFDWNPYAATNPVQGQDGFVARLTFAGQNKIGVTKRLALGEDLEILIQDDLETAQSTETITELEIYAEGHIVE